MSIRPVPEVSVVIPTQNRCARLSSALHTALSQEDVDHEVVVVDDGSEDETPVMLSTHEDRRLRFVRHDVPRGLAASRNDGVAVARGRWVAFLDDDDLWAPNKLAAQLAALAQNASAGWCAVGSVTLDSDLRITGGKRTPPPESVGRLLLAQNVIPGGGSGVIVETSLFADVGGFDPRFSLVADRELWIRLSQRSGLACVDRALVGYVLHGANLSTAGRGYEEELLTLEEKYRHRGPAVSADIPRASLAAREGRRGAAVGLLLRGAVRHRRVGPLAKAAVIAAGRSAEKAARRVEAGALPHWWLAEAEGWLASLRAHADAHQGACG